jgi:two-component system NarL family sensor kinase
LHDEAGHTLATAIFRLDLEARRLAPDSAEAIALSRSRDALRLCAETLHNLAFTLHPRILADLGLIPALRSLIAQVEEIGQLQIGLTVEGTPDQLRPEVKLAAFRVVQEALTNVRKHAETDRAWVTLRFGDRQLQITIEDPGVGLVADPMVVSRSATLGLGGMRERVELLGGKFRLISRAESGLIVSACLPLNDTGGSI